MLCAQMDDAPKQKFVYAGTWPIDGRRKKTEENELGILCVATVNKCICEHRLISHFI